MKHSSHQEMREIVPVPQAIDVDVALENTQRQVQTGIICGANVMWRITCVVEWSLRETIEIQSTCAARSSEIDSEQRMWRTRTAKKQTQQFHQQNQINQ